MHLQKPNLYSKGFLIKTVSFGNNLSIFGRFSAQKAPTLQSVVHTLHTNYSTLCSACQYSAWFFVENRLVPFPELAKCAVSALSQKRANLRLPCVKGFASVRSTLAGVAETGSETAKRLECKKTILQSACADSSLYTREPFFAREGELSSPKNAPCGAFVIIFFPPRRKRTRGSVSGVRFPCCRKAPPACPLRK